MTSEEEHAFLAAIDALGTKELLILVKGFSRQVVGTRFSCGLDLLHETLFRVLSGKRQWRKDIVLGAFLHEAMRSVLSVDTRAGTLAPLSYEEWMAPTDYGPDEFGAPPETLLLRKEDMAQARQSIEAARKHFTHDEAAHQILRSESLDMTPSETRDAYGISKKAYKAARERIARNIRTHAKLQ